MGRSSAEAISGGDSPVYEKTSGGLKSSSLVFSPMQRIQKPYSQLVEMLFCMLDRWVRKDETKILLAEHNVLFRS